MDFSVKKLTLRWFDCLEYTGQVPSLCCLESWNPQMSFLTSLNNQRVNNSLIQSMNWSHCRGSTFSHAASLSQYLCPMFFYFPICKEMERQPRQRAARREVWSFPTSAPPAEQLLCCADAAVGQWPTSSGDHLNPQAGAKIFPKDKEHSHRGVGGSLCSHYNFWPELESVSNVPSSYS